MTERWVIPVLLAACAASPPPPPATVVEYEMHGELGPPGQSGVSGPSGPSGSVREQPPAIKLKLGHLRNDRLGIGVTIDLTEATDSVADIDPAKLRFDGETTIWRLEGHDAGIDRIDYVRENDRVMLQMYRGGHFVVFVPDPVTDRASEPIELYRDGDADPLTQGAP